MSGTWFTGPPTVRFGSTATTLTIDSSTQTTAIAPAHAAGDVQVTVTGSGGTSNGRTYTCVGSRQLTGRRRGSGDGPIALGPIGSDALPSRH
ncbi:IPT/TIG domain-containing protein [Nocardia sp. NPDC047654]|uniref:IPT/TIG domain-containing protein n=1 Tax=Nocardia sp. NPDC047654 TaxID=3364314 RepID=UPI00372022A2